MAQLMGEFLQTSMKSLKDLSNASIITIALWKINKNDFPFYDSNSNMFISSRKSSESMTISEYREQNKMIWFKLLKCIASFHIESLKPLLEEFQTAYFEKALEGDEDALEYFWLLFFEFFSKTSYLVFKKFEGRYQEIINRLKELASDSSSKCSGNKLPQSSPESPCSHSALHLVRGSHSRNADIAGSKQYQITEKSVQDLVMLVDDRDSQLQLLREDLLFRERKQ